VWAAMTPAQREADLLDKLRAVAWVPHAPRRPGDDGQLVAQARR
jgi:hypothetical protein